MSNQSSKQLVLIYGESNHGKTTLGNQLEGHYGYQVIRLDKVYVKFIKTKYPEFDVPDLYRVIGQHYGLILARLDAEGSAAEGATIGLAEPS